MQLKIWQGSNALEPCRAVHGNSLTLQLKIWHGLNVLEPCCAVHGNGSTLQLKIWRGSNVCKMVQNTQQRKKEINNDENSFAFFFTESKYTMRTIHCTISITIQFEKP